MQPTPKKIKPTTNQDYASIYEDNFIKTNNPAQLGQQAFTRQLSQGITNKLNPTQTGFVFTDVVPTTTDPSTATLMGSGTTGGGASGDGTLSGGGNSTSTVTPAPTYATVSAPRAPRTDKVSLFEPNPTTAEGAYYNQFIDPNRNGPTSQEQFIDAPEEAATTVRDTIATGITDAMFAILGGKEKVVQSITDAAMPALQEVDKYFTGEKDFIKDVTGITIPRNDPRFDSRIEDFGGYPGAAPVDYTTNQGAVGQKVINPETKKLETVGLPGVSDIPKGMEQTGDFGFAVNQNGTLGDLKTLEEIAGGATGTTETETPTVTSTGAGAQTRTGKPGTTGQDELGLADAVQTGDQTGEVLPTENQTPPTPGAEEVGSGTVDDAKTRVSNSVQTRVEDLTNNLNQRIDQAEQFYAREYDRILNQIAMRARQSQVGGFTGGIQEQINQFASAAEIQQLNALAVERNNTIQALEAERANIPMQAQQYANELLTAELQNENIRTQALSTLYTDVINGVRTIEEAQAFADQYGLGNIQELMDRVALTQFALTPKFDPETGNVEPYTIDDIRQSFPGKTDEELQDIVDSLNNGSALTDFSGLGGEEAVVADTLMSIIDGEDADSDRMGFAASAALAAATAAFLIPGIGWIAGGIITAASALGAFGAGVGTTISSDDVNDVLSGLAQTEFFQTEGNLSSLLTAQAETTIARPSAVAGETVSGFGDLNDTFTVTINGSPYKVPGHQILALAIILKQNGVLDDSPEIKEVAETIYKSMPGFSLGRMFGAVTGDVKNVTYRLYKQTFNK